MISGPEVTLSHLGPVCSQKRKLRPRDALSELPSVTRCVVARVRPGSSPLLPFPGLVAYSLLWEVKATFQGWFCFAYHKSGHCWGQWPRCKELAGLGF